MKYALAIDVGVSEKQVSVILEYWTSDFTRQQAANISSTFIKTLNSIVAQPKMQVVNIDMVSEDHIHQMQRFNAETTDATYKCIHDVIQDQVAASPDHEAICSWEGSWTYKELDDASTKLAQHLVELGVGPEVIVPYCFPKSAFAIISILAILKAGGAGVAFDPSHPVERLEGLADQVKAKTVLTTSQYTNLFDRSSEVVNVIAVNEDLLSSLPGSEQPVRSAVKPSNAAFIVFTSGTTGMYHEISFLMNFEAC